MMPVKPIPHSPFLAGLFRKYDRIVLPLFGKIAVEGKADGSAVTMADRNASAEVVKSLIRHTPDHGVISEEEKEPYQSSADWQWAIDPLDGTAAFARGLPVWGIGIGLLHKAQPREGYLHFPIVKETYAFHDGKGVLNGKQLKLPSLPVAPDCRNVMITSIHSFVDVRCVKGLRLHNFGSNLYHMMALATGRCEAIITGSCQLWDLAPALPFTRALGYVERYLDGSPLVLADIMRRSDFGFPIKQPLIVGPLKQVEVLLKMIGKG